MIPSILNKSYFIFLVSALLMFFFYHEVILDINSYVFAGGGDGIKNYYTYMYHAKHDQDFWLFSGMNYPFYENIVFTDAHPLLSYLIGKMGLVTYGIGILNALMLISYPISSIFIFKILRYYKVNAIWAFLSGIAICFMAPQLFRMTGHLSLSYAFAIPLMWYLLIKITDEKKIIWTVLMTLLLILFFFTHPYLGLIIAMFGLAYVLVFSIFNRKTFWYNSLRIAGPILLSIFLFQALVNATDTHEDRMKTPAGFYHYGANKNSILIAHHGPLNTLLNTLKKNKIIKVNEAIWETRSYIGFSTVVFLGIGLVYYLRKRKEISLRVIFSSPIGKLYLVGHLILLFSFCIPFKYDAFHWIPEAITPLKQFRVLGRFTWVYFYVVTITAIVLLAQLKNRATDKKRWQIIYGLGIIFMVFEFYPAHISVSEKIREHKNPFQMHHLSPNLRAVINWTNEHDYDAIIFLPFTHFSSENVFMLGSEQANRSAMILNYHTKVPLINTISSRTSVTESIMYQNLFAPSFIEKELTQVIGYDKKILLIKTNEDLDKNENRMVQAGVEVFRNDTYTVFDFSLEKWNSPNDFNKVLTMQEKANTALRAGWYSDTSNVFFIYDSFDELKEVNSMFGKGALAGKKSNYNIIKSDIPPLEIGEYTCSFWYNIRIDRPDQLAIVEQKFTDGSAKWVTEVDIRQTNFIVNDWAFVELKFKVTEKVSETKIILSGNNSQKWFVVDELLIRKSHGAPLFKKGKLENGEYLIYNNFWINRASFSEKK